MSRWDHQRLRGVEKLAEVESRRREQLYRKQRPVWTKVNRAELLVAGTIIALIVAWVLYLVLA